MLSPVAIEKYKKECWKEICTLPTDLTGAGHDTGKTTQRVIYHGEIFPQVELSKRPPGAREPFRLFKHLTSVRYYSDIHGNNNR